MDNKENFKEELKNEEKSEKAPQSVKKPVYKNWWFWAIIATVILVIALGSSGGGESSGDNGENSGAGDLGDYSVSVLDFRLAKDFEGKPVIIVKYNFKNNGDESKSFFIAFDESAYQEGVGLNTCYFVDESANYSADNQTKEIKPGADIDVEVAYVLNDSNTDVDIEVKELFGFSDKIVKKTFVIGTGKSEGGGANTDNLQTDTPECNLGDYYVEILGFRLDEDYEGNSVVIVKYKFTNNDEDSTAFAWSFEDIVYQNGVGLNECYFLDDDSDYSSDNQTKEIKKGASIDVEVAYELNDSTTDIEVEVKEFYGFRDEVVTKTFSIK